MEVLQRNAGTLVSMRVIRGLHCSKDLTLLMALKLYSSGSLTSVNGYDIVHGSYMISQTAKQINVGDKVEFDWKAVGDR